ncbi:MAG: hypothetical protein ACMUIS_02240 [bacterium]
MNDCQFFWYMVAQWAVAAGTIFVAIVALWGHMIRARWFGPKLRLALKNPKGEISMFSDGVVSRYFHLRVWNERRASPAHNVRVVIMELYRPNADGTMSQVTLSGPLQLAWQFQGSNPQFQTIGAESTCDLGYLRRGEPFTLSTLFHHISFDPNVQPGQKAIFILRALSDECESDELKIEVAWDGIWSEDSDEIIRHMVVKLLPRK